MKSQFENIWALPCLYRESQVLTYFFITDVFVGGFVTNKKLYLSAPHLLFKLCNESTDTLVCLKPYTSIRQRQLNVGDAIEKLRAYIS